MTDNKRETKNSQANTEFLMDTVELQIVQYIDFVSFS